MLCYNPCTFINFRIDAMSFSNSAFGLGSGPQYLDTVQCTGLEASLSACPATRTPSCSSGDGAGVLCNATCERFFLDSKRKAAPS